MHWYNQKYLVWERWYRLNYRCLVATSVLNSELALTHAIKSRRSDFTHTLSSIALRSAEIPHLAKFHSPYPLPSSTFLYLNSHSSGPPRIHNLTTMR
jgi:hypothetical protein